MKKIIVFSAICFLLQMNVQGQPVMDYPEVYDFGTVLKNSDPYRTFMIYNKGNEPLFISNARSTNDLYASLIPTYPKEPIFPGDSAVFKIRYATKRLGAFSMNISIVTNEGVKRNIKVEGEVLTEKGDSWGEVLFNLEKYDAAIKEFTKVVNIKPNNSKAFYYRGHSFFLLKKREEAILDYTRVVQLEPENALAYFYRGVAQYTLGNYHSALADVNGAIKISNTDSRFYRLRGQVKNRLGKKEEACSDFYKSKELGNQNVGKEIEKYCN